MYAVIGSKVSSHHRALVHSSESDDRANTRPLRPLPLLSTSDLQMPGLS